MARRGVGAGWRRRRRRQAARRGFPAPTLSAPLPPRARAQESLAQLKSDGNALFAKKDYDSALTAYDKALGLVPADAADAALLHSNKAACHMMQKRWVLAVVGGAPPGCQGAWWLRLRSDGCGRAPHPGVAAALRRARWGFHPSPLQVPGLRCSRQVTPQSEPARCFASWFNDHPHPTPPTSAAPPPTSNRRYKEAVAECSAALEGQPNFFKALVRRAKAYEQLGQPKQALADLQRANRLDAATADTRVRGFGVAFVAMLLLLPPWVLPPWVLC